MGPFCQQWNRPTQRFPQGHVQDTMNGPINREVEVRVIEHDVGRLSAKFEGDVLQVGLGCGLHYPAPDGRGSRECDLVNAHVLRDGLTAYVSVTRDDVHDAGWETGLLDD